VVGETVTVEADIFADGHDSLAAVLRYKKGNATSPPGGEVAPRSGAGGDPPSGAGGDWTEVPMVALVNDRWTAEFPVTELGRYVFTIEAWVDHFETWSKQLAKRIAAGPEFKQDVKVELEAGARMLEETATRIAGRTQGADSSAGRAPGADSKSDGHVADASRLTAFANSLRRGKPAALD